MHTALVELVTVLNQVNKRKKMEPSITLYIAFSIHGTNTFITATRVVSKSAAVQELDKLSAQGISGALSRRPDYNFNKEQKLHWSALTTKAGAPLRSPALVLNRFNRLANDGWTVTKGAFVAKHWPKRAAPKQVQA